MVGVCKNVLGTSMTNRFVLLTVLLLRAMDSMGTTVFQEVTYINDTNTTCEVPQATFQIVGMPGEISYPTVSIHMRKKENETIHESFADIVGRLQVFWSRVR